MLTFRCERVPINDLAANGGCVGWFTGEIRVEADMRRVDFIDGCGEFLSDEAAQRIELRDLCVDLNAAKTAPYCLYTEAKPEE